MGLANIRLCLYVRARACVYGRDCAFEFQHTGLFSVTEVEFFLQAFRAASVSDLGEIVHSWLVLSLFSEDLQHSTVCFCWRLRKHTLFFFSTLDSDCATGSIHMKPE